MLTVLSNNRKWKEICKKVVEDNMPSSCTTTYYICKQIIDRLELVEKGLVQEIHLTNEEMECMISLHRMYNAWQSNKFHESYKE